ncbi:hypothetical protein QBC46DRAFT_174552 [Diplogelasinospora grovesii]|uniref:Nucleotide-diphospho-sugar transferase domain-containing protein n=1 Tax=Diplogelasinospora grovesii TaxID=303347 RepID=A0AAN6S2C7_9PEZI|nr:hypothetical protein QBC46DRAFT_174552 [Diplogelasinospora grovesii]
MSALPSIPQSWRRIVLLLPVIVVALGFTTGFFGSSLKPKLPKVVFEPESPPGPFHRECKTANESSRLDELSDVIRALWAPLVLPVTEPTFTTLDGDKKHLPPTEQLIHTKSLGKRICILDVDTRGLSGDGDVFGSHLPTWGNLAFSSAGFLSHYLYAQIHGYTYKFVRAPTYHDRAPHWTKVIFTQELLKRYDIVVMLDYDAMFPSPELPLEWLLNYWKIDREVMVAMAEDPDVDVNLDLRGKINVNTGFIIAQSSENTQRLFKDWAECPDETRYKGCARWKREAFHEQAAFSSHVRYDFLDGLSVETHPQYIRVLPCAEANGIPEKRHLGCMGQLVRHYWGDKTLTNRELSQIVMRAFTPLLTSAAYSSQEVVEDYRTHALEGDKILDQS